MQELVMTTTLSQLAIVCQDSPKLIDAEHFTMKSENVSVNSVVLRPCMVSAEGAISEHFG